MSLLQQPPVTSMRQGSVGPTIIGQSLYVTRSSNTGHLPVGFQKKQKIFSSNDTRAASLTSSPGNSWQNPASNPGVRNVLGHDEIKPQIRAAYENL
jgi:hypothetical protein